MSIVPVTDVAHLNNEPRQEIYQDEDIQIAVMSIPMGGNIPNEVHPNNTQITTVVEGVATVFVDGNFNKFGTLAAGDCVVIPKGQYHMIANHGTKPLKIYSIYVPPEED